MSGFAVRGDGPSVHRDDCHHIRTAVGDVELLTRDRAQKVLDDDPRRRRCGLCRPDLRPPAHQERHHRSLRRPLAGPRPATVYRFYAANWLLLYVGKTTDAQHRWSQHQATQLWWTSVATIHVEHFDSEEAAYAAEAAAIRDEHPLHNHARGRS